MRERDFVRRVFRVMAMAKTIRQVALKTTHTDLIDASDGRLRTRLSELPPRQELVVRIALNGRAKNQGPDWGRRVAALMRVCKIDTTGVMARLLVPVRNQGEVIAAGPMAMTNSTDDKPNKRSHEG
jgi:hypothetical protein